VGDLRKILTVAVRSCSWTWGEGGREGGREGEVVRGLGFRGRLDRGFDGGGEELQLDLGVCVEINDK